MKVVAASETGELDGLLNAGWGASQEVVDEVAQILADVRGRGDAAVVEYARRFDDQSFDLSKLRVPIPMLDGARSLVSQEVAAALALAKDRIARFHERQRQPDIAYVEEDGTRYAVRRRALRSVAVYAPRSGAAAGILMGAVPAKIAGVARVIALSPASADGLAGAVSFACAIGGVDELYAAGGAAAIAAAAFGTDSIAPVDKVVGRGGIWTTEAKRQVFGWCGVDALAGPTEVLIVADDGANSEYVVGELLAQAELPGATRLAVLSESRPLLEAVAQLIDTLDLRTFERHEFVTDADSDALPSDRGALERGALRGRQSVRAGISLSAGSRRFSLFGPHQHGRHGLRRRYDAAGKRRIPCRHEPGRANVGNGAFRVEPFSGRVHPQFQRRRKHERADRERRSGARIACRGRRPAAPRSNCAYEVRRLTAPALVAFDVDGTLVGRDLVISKNVRDAIARMQQTATTGCLVTGRMYRATLPFARETRFRRAADLLPGRCNHRSHDRRVARAHRACKRDRPRANRARRTRPHAPAALSQRRVLLRGAQSVLGPLRVAFADRAGRRTLSAGSIHV